MSSSRVLKTFVCCTLLFLAGAAAGLFLPRLCPFMRQQAEEVTKTDTLTIRDTAVDRRPGMADITADSLLLLKLPSLPDIPDIGFAPDTVHKRDTVYVPARWVQLRYDRPDYRAWVSGYHLDGRGPQLDSVYVYPETRYITKETIFVAPRKCNSIALESSASWCGTWSLTLSFEYEHVTRWGYIGAGAGYDVVSGRPYVSARIGLPLWRW